MASGRWITLRADWPRLRGLLLAVALALCGAPALADCARPVYLTFDTGHMGVADLIADVLNRHGVKATFFAAQEKSMVGDGSLGGHWAPWWKARAAEGHEFASHTWDHVVWRSDVAGNPPAWRMRPGSGEQAGQERIFGAADYCRQLRSASDRLRELTGRAPLPLFRAPAGRTSPTLLAAAQACGYRHVGWAPAGFLGDELPSERAGNAALLQAALRDVRPGDILMAHLGIWSRKDPWAPAVLEPLIVGLKERGFCFQTLRDHPSYRDWVRNRG